MVPPPRRRRRLPRHRRRMNKLLWDMLCLVCKAYKTQTLAVLFVLLEVISVILEIFGKNTVGSVLASFILSVFSVVVTLYATFVMELTLGNNQLVAVEIVFSFVQLIVTYMDLTMKFLCTKSNYKVSLFPLAVAIIALVFAFKKNPIDSLNERHADSSILTIHFRWEPPTVMSEPLIHNRFLQYVLQKITEVCDIVCKYKIHVLAVVFLVLDAISSVALDQLSGQSKQSFVLATSLLLPVFGFACIKGRTERQLIGVVEVVFAMVQLIITTLVHFTLTISGATNNYNAPWFSLAFAAIVMFVFNKDDSFKAIPMPDSGIVQRYIDREELINLPYFEIAQREGLNGYEDLYRKVEQMYNIEGQLVGPESKWELNYINEGHKWQVVKTRSDNPRDWQTFRFGVKVMIIRRRSLSTEGPVPHDLDDDDDGNVNDGYEEDDASDVDDYGSASDDDDDDGSVNDRDEGDDDNDGDGDGDGASDEEVDASDNDEGEDDDDDDGIVNDGDEEVDASGDDDDDDDGSVNDRDEGDDDNDDGVKDDDDGVNDGGKRKKCL